MQSQMPAVNFQTLRNLLDDEDYQIALRCLNPKTGTLRASKPTVDRSRPETGIAAYAWRMAAFSVSPISQHQCMPCTADFDLPDGDYSWDDPESVKVAGRAIRKAAQQRGDRIEEAIVHSVSVREWHGVRRWGNAFGVIDQPYVTTEGAIIYR